jgi:lipopolysaccharide cholinephosphotransferase
MLRLFDSVCTTHGLRYWLDGGTLLGAVRHVGFIPWDDDIDLVMPRPDFERFLGVAPQSLPEDMYIQTLESDKRYKRFTVPCRVRDRYSVIAETNRENADAPLGFFIDVIPADKYHAAGLLRLRDRFLKFAYYAWCEYMDAAVKPPRDPMQLVKNFVLHLRPALASIFPIRTFRSFLKSTALGNERLESGYEIGYSLDSRWRRYFKPDDIYPLAKIPFEGFEFPAPHNPDGVLRVFYGSTYMQVPPESKRALPHYSIVEVDTRKRPGNARMDKQPL